MAKIKQMTGKKHRVPPLVEMDSKAWEGTPLGPLD